MHIRKILLTLALTSFGAHGLPHGLSDAAEHETARHDDGYEGLLGDVLLKRAKEDDGYEGIGLKRANHDDGYEGLLDNVLLKRAKEDDGYEGLGLKRANHDDDGEGADETH